MAGTLFVVATPLGNLGDITARALEVLRSAALVACEDTRRTRGLLSHFGIHPPRVISCHGFNERRQASPILAELRAGHDVALVSDGGTPGVSDPGAVVVDAALAEGLRVSPIPGPSAVAAAMSVCGLPAGGFVFAGFLPPRSGARRKAVEALAGHAVPLVLFEAPHRVAACVADLRDLLGDRPVTLLREATKLHEEVRRTTLEELAVSLKEGTVPPRGEFTLVVEGRRAGQRPGAVDPAALSARYHELLEQGVERREALRRLARESGLPRRAVYDAVRRPDEDRSGSGGRG
jgi:16S rRNA (cytidine1402-2'-O)-methyltransferase